MGLFMSEDLSSLSKFYDQLLKNTDFLLKWFYMCVFTTREAQRRAKQEPVNAVKPLNLCSGADGNLD